MKFVLDFEQNIPLCTVLSIFAKPTIIVFVCRFGMAHSSPYLILLGMVMRLRQCNSPQKYLAKYFECKWICSYISCISILHSFVWNQVALSFKTQKIFLWETTTIITEQVYSSIIYNKDLFFNPYCNQWVLSEKNESNPYIIESYWEPANICSKITLIKNYWSRCILTNNKIDLINLTPKAISFETLPLFALR